MPALSSTMSDMARSLDKDTATLADNSIKLRNALLDLQPKIINVDSYTNSGSEEKWKAIRREYDTLLNSLNTTAKFCADTIGGYVVLLPVIDREDMFQDGRVELKALIEHLKEDRSQANLTVKFKKLEQNIAQFISWIACIVANRDVEVNILSAEAEEQVSHAQAEVSRLKAEETDQHNSYVVEGTTKKKPSQNMKDLTSDPYRQGVKDPIDTMGQNSVTNLTEVNASKLLTSTVEESVNLNVIDKSYDVLSQVVKEPTDEAGRMQTTSLMDILSSPPSFTLGSRLFGSKSVTANKKATLNVKDKVSREPAANLTAAKNQLALAYETQIKADAQVRARQNADWPRTWTSLTSVSTLVTVVSEHLVIDHARKVLTAEVNGHLAAFDTFAEERTPDNQLALANYHRKARDNEPKFISVMNSLEQFAREFK